MEEIKQWLADQNRNIVQGFDLLKKNSKNSNVIKAIDRDMSKPYKQDYVREMLDHHLGKLAGVTASQPVTIEVATDEKQTKDSQQGTGFIFADSKLIDLEKLPTELQEKYIGIKDGYKAMSEYHTILQDEKATDDERAAALQKLEATNDSINDAWQQIKAYCDVKPEAKKVETFPENLNEFGQNLIDAYKRFYTAKDNISRVEKELVGMKDEKKIAKKTEAINGWKNEMEDCKVILSGIRF